MNYRLILRLLGRTLLLLAACLLLPLLVSLYYGENPAPFLLSLLIVLLLALPLLTLRAESAIFDLEGFVIVAAIWLCFCLFGALPFFFSGYFDSFIDCLFEITSGFTTTGASILTDIESLPRGILFWRSFSSWLGGMGVLLFTLAFLPKTGERTHALMRAESPGPVKTKLVPKTAESSQILYTIYIALTLAEIIALLIAGMPLYEATVHSFATVCTGGFSTMNLSVASFDSPAIENIITVFMLLSGVNFSVYFLVLTKRFASIFKSDELRCYLGITLSAVALIFLNLYFSTEGDFAVGDTLRDVFFQVASIITTTGFSTADFNVWPEFSRIILLLLMVMGGCAGSTAGGIKVARALLLTRCIHRNFIKMSHPRVFKLVKLDRQAVEERTLQQLYAFFACYCLIMGLSVLVIALDNFSFETTVTAVFAAIGNIGPGFDMVGPLGNFSEFSGLSKLLLSLCMLIGRLEIFPILLFLAPSTWKRF